MAERRNVVFIMEMDVVGYGTCGSVGDRTQQTNLGHLAVRNTATTPKK